MGTAAVVERFTREFPNVRALDRDEETEVWREVREFTPRFLEGNPSGGVVTMACSLVDMRAVAEKLAAANVPFIARAGREPFTRTTRRTPPVVTVGTMLR